MRVVILYVTRICYFEILDLEAGDVIHRDFEDHRYRADLLPALRGSWLLKRDLCNHVVLDTTLELLYGPFCLLFLLFELVCLTLYTLWQLKCHIGCSSRHRELHCYLRCKVIRWELRPYLHSELQLILGHLVDERINAERRRILSVYAVVHNEKFTIWRLDCDCLHCFKVAHIDAFMEVAVVKDDTTHLARC